ncbi:unnamed protein product [Schistosoma mattheei]|uniref:Vesicle transport protein n=1 Tax=Schistosoma mattheei TaxID=31246 RepID=A0AA85C525_9TREM|nr:unnamed protein product [Schistosoma mattheei]
MDKVKQWFTRDDDEQGIFTDVENGCSLSWSTRIKAFIICLVGSLCLWLPGAGITLFALFYTLGNICSLGSTIFLMGPVNQLKRMFQETRIFAAVIMLVCLVLTIVFALLGLRLLCLIFCILQSLALTWYSLSYIPYASFQESLFIDA